MAKNASIPTPKENEEAQLAIAALRERAEVFSKAFATEGYERGKAQSFIIHLCQVFGLDSIRAVSLEHRVKKDSGVGMEFMDGFFPGLLLIEMKSSGKDLAAAYSQARGYAAKLKNPEEMPRYILVCDFQNFHLYDLDASETDYVAFRLADLSQHVDSTLAFLVTYERVYQDVQVRITTRAAGTLTLLHDALKLTRYPQADIQSFLVRILFCLFGEDTKLFGDSRPFYRLIEQSQSNGRGLGLAINQVFERLNTPHETPDLTAAFDDLTEDEKAFYHFPYVNGALFAAPIAAANFNEATRRALLKCCETDWSLISPDIFGTMFQNLMHWDDELAGNKGGKRRDFGAHYTSERNILRAIRPLFIDGLHEELKAAKGLDKKAERKQALEALYNKLPRLTVLDPACGCGNFLVVAYRELRRIELELIDALFSKGGQTKGLLDVRELVRVRVNQFYGIEIDPTAAEIAAVAMWLTDHQLNLQTAERFGSTRPSIPLRQSAHIARGKNALQIDWNDVLPAQDCSFIVGNPPFIGKAFQSEAQKEDMALVFGSQHKHSLLDYVAAWYVKAATHMKANPAIKSAFVSTNSITQGEQVAVLWQPLIQAGLHIHFAHRTFKWNNEGSSVAAVHCVIIGFGFEKPKKCQLWDYQNNTDRDGRLIRAKRLNPYLVDAPVITLENRRHSLCSAPPIVFGNMPNDGGHLLLDEFEKNELLKSEPRAAQWIKPIVSAREFLNNEKRWCLWLKDQIDNRWQDLPLVAKRVEAVRQYRLESTRASTAQLAQTPHLFGEIRQPSGKYILIPRVSSENRHYVPIGFFDETIIVSDTCLSVNSTATVYHFAVLSSTFHNAWLRATGGRLKSDYRYSNTIVYNNYPWPNQVSEEDAEAIKLAGQTVLDVRARHKGKSLASLYNPDTMPPDLRDAHDEVDFCVDAAYGYEGGNEDAPRAAFLFGLYQQLTTLLPQVDDEETAVAKPKRAKC